MVAIRSADPDRSGLSSGPGCGHRVWKASQAPLAAKRAIHGIDLVQPDAVLEVAYGVLDLGVAAMVGLQFQLSPRPGR